MRTNKARLPHLFTHFLFSLLQCCFPNPHPNTGPMTHSIPDGDCGSPPHSDSDGSCGGLGALPHPDDGRLPPTTMVVVVQIDGGGGSARDGLADVCDCARDPRPH